MLRIAMIVVLAGLSVVVAIASVSAQAPGSQPVAIDLPSASRALDAVPAVFTVARNLDGVDIDVGIESMADGFSGLVDQAVAQEQLNAALGAYGFEGYKDWAATVRSIFSTYAYIQSMAATTPEIDAALQNVLSDLGIPQSQKDAIVARMNDTKSGVTGTVAATPSQENLAAVIALVPRIESTIEMMQAMQ